MRYVFIRLSGENSDYTYTFKDGPKYNMTVKGLIADLDDFQAVSLAPSIDVTGYGVGTYTFTVTFRETEHIQIMHTIRVKLEIAAVSTPIFILELICFALIKHFRKFSLWILCWFASSSER